MPGVRGRFLFTPPRVVAATAPGGTSTAAELELLASEEERD